MSTRRVLAREWLWALGSVAVVFAFFALVLALSKGGEWSGTGEQANGWSMFAHFFFVGNFWRIVAVLYVVVLIVRLTAWSVRTVRNRQTI